MRILATFAGNFGDILWGLPAIRALSRRIGSPIDLWLAGSSASIIPLLESQEYIGAVTADPAWGISSPATVPTVPSGYDAVFHLSYRGWPQLALPFETLNCLNCANQFPTRINVGVHPIPDSELALDEPWITVEPWTQLPHPLVIGFSDNHFELKYGLLKLVNANLDFDGTGFLLVAPTSRWHTETEFQPTDWIENARRLTSAKVFLGCCSALHVLACAVGTKVVMCEPMEARWNDIFYPYGKTGPQVTLVLGNDDRPTFDARAVRQAVEEALNG